MGEFALKRRETCAMCGQSFNATELLGECRPAVDELADRLAADGSADGAAAAADYAALVERIDVLTSINIVGVPNAKH